MRQHSDSNRTTTAFLGSLRDQRDWEAWMEFDRRYAGMIRGVARRAGLDPSETEDAVQETLLQFVQSYRDGGYDRGKGRLTHWVLGIARHRALSLVRKRGRHKHALLDGVEEPSHDEFEQQWLLEERSARLGAALTALQCNYRLEPRTLEVFQLTVIEGLRPAEVADRLGMTREHVYVAKHTCLQRLRHHLGTSQP